VPKRHERSGKRGGRYASIDVAPIEERGLESTENRERPQCRQGSRVRRSVSGERFIEQGGRKRGTGPVLRAFERGGSYLEQGSVLCNVEQDTMVVYSLLSRSIARKKMNRDPLFLSINSLLCENQIYAKVKLEQRRGMGEKKKNRGNKVREGEGLSQTKPQIWNKRNA